MKILLPKPCGDWCDNCGVIHEPDGGFPSPRLMVKFDGFNWTIFEPGDEKLLPDRESSNESE